MSLVFVLCRTASCLSIYAASCTWRCSQKGTGSAFVWLSVCVSACQNGAPSLVACEVTEQEACGLDLCLKICGLLCLDDIKCNEARRIHPNGCLCVPQSSSLQTCMTAVFGLPTSGTCAFTLGSDIEKYVSSVQALPAPSLKIPPIPSKQPSLPHVLC